MGTDWIHAYALEEDRLGTGDTGTVSQVDRDN